MKHVSRQQLVSSLQILASFRKEVNRQGVQHIIPFLALRQKKVSEKGYTKYSESDDYAFFDSYFRVRDDKKPYFDPIASLFRIDTHPHSNVATARKGTFFRSWNAAKNEIDSRTRDEMWRLTPKYIEIIKQKALTKGKKVTKVPAIPLAAFIFRSKGFNDKFMTLDLADALKKEFSLTDTEFSELFETQSQIQNFSDVPLSKEDILAAIEESGVVAEVRESRTDFQERVITDDDAVLSQVQSLLSEDGYAGVIFVGPPGTSKSWYAVQVALALADGDISRVTKIQFHKSYQYEHFVEGFVPNSTGTGFELREQLMINVIKEAELNQGNTYVVLIDELSRSDPGRVFGELLTYIEPSRRGELFKLASGREIAIPPNIVFIATMNSRDKSVSEIDDAFERRMAKIEFGPNKQILESILKENNVAEDLAKRIAGFFEWVNTKYPLGHAFFLSVRDEQSLLRLWSTQLRFVFEKQFKYERDVLASIKEQFQSITGVKVLS